MKRRMRGEWDRGKEEDRKRDFTRHPSPLTPLTLVPVRVHLVQQ